MLTVVGAIPGCGCVDLYCARGSQGVLSLRVGIKASQSIGTTISDASVRSELWLTATCSYPLGYFSSITASIDN